MKLTPCTVKLPHSNKHAYLSSPRCGARTRQGLPCKAPAIKDKIRCRMHGGKGSGAPKGSQNALKHGHTTVVAKEKRNEVRFLIKQSRGLLESFYFEP